MTITDTSVRANNEGVNKMDEDLNQSKKTKRAIMNYYNGNDSEDYDCIRRKRRED
jgi:hypothetical protein